MTDGTLNEVEDSLITTLDSNTTSDALALHFHENLRVGNIHLFPSGRLEIVRTDALSELQNSNPITRATYLPGFGIMYRGSDEYDVFAGIHRGFSPVAPGQSEEVLPETTWNSEAGIRYHSHGTHVEGIGFFNDYNNIVGQCTFSSGCGNESIDNRI